MLDIATIRDNQDKVRELLKIRAPKFPFDAFLKLDVKRRTLQMELDTLRSQKNRKNDEISQLLKEKKDAKPVIAQMKEFSRKIAELEAGTETVESEFKAQLFLIPNLPHESVKPGVDAKGNTEVSHHGDIPKLSFKPKEHTELGEGLGILDMARASKISGSAFPLFRGAGARLVRALINFMIDQHIRHGYEEIWPPALVNRASMTGTGQLPKFEEDMYRLKDDELFLVPTAEVPVTNLHRDEVLKEEDLPLKYTAYTPCFRREAGSYGKDTKGLVRIHQFDKVELVKFARPEDSYKAHEQLLKDAERILELLEIPYRVIQLCSGDMGFAAAKCYDIEAWAVGLGRWLEVSSVSNFEAFQARRANIRFKRKDSNKSEFVHTLNGSGLALPRVLIAILENNQNANGSVRVPEALRPYMGGLAIINKS
ncbi:MAG: serine--tRNA ligase [Candidatus Omnitrophica bacterium]|nr:serine--tRNA ligase [Candidatus Omnitrophota bacterium]